MKYVYKIIPGVILFMGLAGACKDDDSTSIPGGIAVDKEEITIGPEGGTEQIAVTSYSNWVAGASNHGFSYHRPTVPVRRNASLPSTLP